MNHMLLHLGRRISIIRNAHRCSNSHRIEAICILYIIAAMQQSFVHFTVNDSILLCPAEIPVITFLSVILATLLPKQLTPLATSGEAIAAILLALFFAAVGEDQLVCSPEAPCKIALHRILQI